MILTSTTQAIRFTPSWREGSPNAPVYHLRAGSVIERGQLEAELAGMHNAGRVFAFQLEQVMREGVTTLLADDPGLDRVLEVVALVEDGQDLSADDARMMAEVRGILAEHWPEYRTLITQSQRRTEIAPVVAMKRYCVGWDNAVSEQGEAVAYEAGRDGQVTDKALSALQALDLMVAGNRAYALQYGAGQEGNSARAASSESDPQTSTSDGASKAAGTSAVSDGKKTRASRSKAGSGR